jgi:putative acetyltransferase
MHVRVVQPDDAPTLAELYRDSARGLGPAAYSQSQVDAWASFPDDFDAFRQRILQGVGFASVVGDEIAAFGQLDPVDHVALLYTATRFSRQGHATTIYRRLEAVARAKGVTRISKTASHFSRPLFAREGFTLSEIERSIYKGVVFERFKMEKRLLPSS